MASDPGQILLYKNDGSGEESFCAYNAPFISKIGWSRDGYNFIEWNTQPDGTGDSYFPGDFVGDGSHNPSLYAIWEEILVLQPNLTYNLFWGTGNTFQKLSGKTYISPSGQRVDCSTLTVTFSSSQHFKKFYATAVKSGNDYGFINDVLVDIRETNPTGILLYELTERDANVNFSFTINISSLTSGNGEYRIGLYVQNDDGFWNYEYFLLEANNLQLEENNNLLLQVPVAADFAYSPPGPPEETYPLCVDTENKILFLFNPVTYKVVNFAGTEYYGNIKNIIELYTAIFEYNHICYIRSNVIAKYYTTSYSIESLTSHHTTILRSAWDNFQNSNGEKDIGLGPPISVIFPSS